MKLLSKEFRDELKSWKNNLMSNLPMKMLVLTYSVFIFVMLAGLALQASGVLSTC